MGGNSEHAWGRGEGGECGQAVPRAAEHRIPEPQPVSEVSQPSKESWGISGSISGHPCPPSPEFTSSTDRPR